MKKIKPAASKVDLKKLIRAADSYDHAWLSVRKAFPRKQYGKVREIVQQFSTYKTLREAFDALHGKVARRGPRAELKRAA